MTKRPVSTRSDTPWARGPVNETLLSHFIFPKTRKSEVFDAAGDSQEKGNRVLDGTHRFFEQT